jgi:epidermal growth factor receptor substrate 15
MIGLMFALGGGIYAWQTRRNVAQAMADVQAQQKALSQSPPPLAAPTTIAEPTDGAMLHIQGKLHHLEQDLQKSQARLQATLADRDELSHHYQAQEKVVATLRNQLSQQQATAVDRLNALKRQNQELLQENSHLSARLRHAVNDLTEIRPKLLQLDTWAAKNQQLSDQLQQADQERQAAIAQQLAEREQVGQLEQQIQQLRSSQAQAQQKLHTVHAERDTAQERVQALESTLQQLTTAEQEWQRERAQLNRKLNNLADSQKTLSLTNQELMVKLETTQAQGDRLKVEKKEQAVALQIAQGEVANLQRQLDERQEAQAKTLAQPVTDSDVSLAKSGGAGDRLDTAAPVQESSAGTTAVEQRSNEPATTAAADLSGPHPFTDKKVAILGTLNAMNRETAKVQLQNLDAHYTSAPSSKTDYVVVGKAPGAKLKKAKKLGIPQLSEAQFLELLGQ